MNWCYSCDNCFQISCNVDIFILSDLKVFHTERITNLHTSDINLDLVNQICRKCFVCNLFQLILQNTGHNLLFIFQNDLSSGMNHLIAYQCLEINLFYCMCKWIIINFLDQRIIGFTIQFQHYLASFIVVFQQNFNFFLSKLKGNGTFNFSAEQVTCYKSFSS